MTEHVLLEPGPGLRTVTRSASPGRRAGGERFELGERHDVRRLIAKYVRRPAARMMPWLVTLLVATALGAGWYASDDGHLTPETGLGYWLGIIGATAMLLLLVYPLRKRMPKLRFLGSVPFWFRAHMLLGIIGPVLIVFHSNFKLGALNSNVAFFAMLIVAGSGVIGRYIYGRIHLGLDGRKAAVRQILDDAGEMQGAMLAGIPGCEGITDELAQFAKTAVAPRRGALSSLGAILMLGLRTRVIHARMSRRLRAAVKEEAQRRGWSRRERRSRLASGSDLLAVYFAAIDKAAKFTFYERLFALWHVLHLPLFLLLIASVLVHVFAVHRY